MRTSELVKTLGAAAEEVSAALAELSASYDGRGIRLITAGESVTLATVPEMSAMIEGLVKEELSKDLGKAGLETLAIVAYRGEVGRAEIDHVRGVNSTFVLRSLQVRGLVERVTDPKDERRYLYRPTLDLLRFLGLSSFEELPEYADLKAMIELGSAEAANPTTNPTTSEPKADE
jgi:segregation and condensation protein B